MEDNGSKEINETESNPERYTDEVTQSKIHNHLTDVHDTISAQDIQNIDADISSPAVSKAYGSKTEKLPADKSNKADEVNEDNREQVPNAWNVLD